MILGVHHTAISVPDLAKAREFYRKMFGFTDVFDGEWRGNSSMVDTMMGVSGVDTKMQMISAGNLFLELWEFSHPEPKQRAGDAKVMDHGYTHICFRVNDIEQEYSRLKGLGMEFVSAPQGGAGLFACYGKDPFGNIIELIEASDAISPAVVAAQQ